MFVNLVQAVEKLNAFPSATALADEFDRVGLVGYKYASGNCPIARYLRMPLNIPASDIAVSTHCVLYKSGDGEKRWNRSFKLSTAAIEFVEIFDDGGFEWLHAKEKLNG